jgi:6,7-dimethyl-8-ribityllumazine synthase
MAAAERRVALGVARFYGELAEALESGARAALHEAGIDQVESYSVPGAFELPLIAKFAAESGRFDAVVCLGAVIRGETDHYDYVCTAATDGIMRVTQETGVPCGFGLLTVDNMDQARDRVTGGSKRDTGRHAVEAVLASLEAKDALTGRQPDDSRGARLSEAAG